MILWFYIIIFYFIYYIIYYGFYNIIINCVFIYCFNHLTQTFFNINAYIFFTYNFLGKNKNDFINKNNLKRQLTDHSKNVFFAYD